MDARVTVTVVSRTITVDQYGDSTETETRVDYPGCLYAPRAQAGRTDPRTPAAISGGSVYGPVDMAVDPDDQLIIGGRTFAVDGEPGPWPPFGIEVAVKRWEQP